MNNLIEIYFFRNICQHIAIPDVDHEAKSHCYKCLSCLESFDDLLEVKCHHHQETCKYYCEKCCRQLDSKSAIVIHAIEHNMDDEPKAKYKCEECFLAFYNSGKFDHHQRSCHSASMVTHSNSEPDSDNKQPDKCETVVKKLNHHHYKPGGEKPFSCKECEQSFLQESDLVNHLTTHTGENGHECKCFSQSSNLNDHDKTHTGEKPFKCTDCDKCFAHKCNLKKHLSENPFKCAKCGQRFAHKCNLNHHIKIHTGEKLFRCKDCGKYFAHKFNLNCHTMIHTSERPFKCEDCSKCFAHRSNLNDHIKSHSGEKPFKCTECKKCFAHNFTLNKHFKIHTGDEPYQCLKCGKSFSHRDYLIKHLAINHISKDACTTSV